MTTPLHDPTASPAAPAAPVAPVPPAGRTAPQDPGRTLAIVGMALCWIPIVGLVCGLVARSRSRKAGYPLTLSTWALALSAGFLVINTVIRLA